MRVFALTAAALHVCFCLVLVPVVMIVASVPASDSASSGGWVVLCAVLVALCSWVLLGGVTAGSIKVAAAALAAELAVAIVVLAVALRSSAPDYDGILEFGAALLLPPMIAVMGLVEDQRSE